MTGEAVFSSVLYRTDGPLATITINRPDRMNAFRARTVSSAFLLRIAPSDGVD